MNELQQKLNLINEEASKITPQVLKKDVTVFNITGTLEEGTTPTGTVAITENGIYDVKDKANVDVNVQGSGGASAEVDTTFKNGLTGTQYWSGWTKMIKTLPKNLKMPTTCDYLFSRYQYIQDFSFLSTWDFNDTETCNYMFWNATNFTEINLSGFNPKTWNKADYMFSGCTKLTKLNLKNCKSHPTTSSSNMFQNVPTSCEIITNSTFATWLQSKFPSYTNITIVKADWEV